MVLTVTLCTVSNLCTVWILTRDLQPRLSSDTSIIASTSSSPSSCPCCVSPLQVCTRRVPKTPISRPLF